MAYPSAVDRFRDEDYAQALDRLGLRRLVPQLNEVGRWDHELNEDEQQAIAFARLMLHVPPWVLIDEALDSIDVNTRERVMDMFTRDLAHSGVIYIGRADPKSGFFSRVLHLENDPGMRRLARERADEPRAAGPAPAAAA
jgi:vitamin B12/bleomycin/antimicrobial peptide transport system ATP-binding/permease protein